MPIVSIQATKFIVRGILIIILCLLTQKHPGRRIYMYFQGVTLTIDLCVNYFLIMLVLFPMQPAVSSDGFSDGKHYFYESHPSQQPYLRLGLHRWSSFEPLQCPRLTEPFGLV
jgi:hypothetical protein